MFLIIGYVVILAASLGTYAIHGSLLALWVPTEYVAIVGLTIGGFLAGNDIKYIKKTVGACRPSSRARSSQGALHRPAGDAVRDSCKVRKEGLMSIEADVEDPTPAPSSASTRPCRTIITSWSSSPTTCA